MAINKEPIQFNVPITNADGTATNFFLRWLQERLNTMEATDDTAEGAVNSLAGLQTQITAAQAALDALRLIDLADYDNAVAPADGQVPVYDDASDTWKPGTIAGGGGGAAFELAFKPPAAADYTLFLKGGTAATATKADVADKGFNVLLDARAGDRGVVAVKAMPALPFVIQMRGHAGASGGSEVGHGPCLRSSATGRVMAIWDLAQDSSNYLQRWTTPSDFSSTVGSVNLGSIATNMFSPYYAIGVDAVGLATAYQSNDGVNWFAFTSVNILSDGHWSGGAANQVGMAMFIGSGTFKGSLLVPYFEVITGTATPQVVQNA